MGVLLGLNDDCLAHIFHYLTLEDQLRVTEVCQRFCDVMRLIVWRHMYRNTCLLTKTPHLHQLSLEQFQMFFSKISMVVEHLYIADTSSEAFTSYLGRYGHRPDLEFYLSLHYPMLKALECDYQSIHDGHVRIIAEKCPQLKALRLSSRYITGAYINSIATLHELTVRNCRLESEQLHNVLTQLKELKFLDIVGNPQLVVALNNTLNICNLTVLCIPEAAITNSLIDHVQHMSQLQLLHVDGLMQTPKTTNVWPYFMERFGSRIRQLLMYNVREYTSIVNDLMACCRMFKRLETIELRSIQNIGDIKMFLQLPSVKILTLEARNFEKNFLQITESSPTVLHYCVVGLCFSERSFEELLSKLIDHIEQLQTSERIQSTEVITLHIQEPSDASYLEHLKKALQSDKYSKQNRLAVEFFRKPIELLLPTAYYVQFRFHQSIVDDTVTEDYHNGHYGCYRPHLDAYLRENIEFLNSFNAGSKIF